MPLSRRLVLRSLFALPLSVVLSPARARARGFVMPDAVDRAEALGSLDGLAPGLRAALTPTAADRPIPRPGPDSWLALREEPGQTFAEFQRSRHNRPGGARRTLVVRQLDATSRRRSSSSRSSSGRRSRWPRCARRAARAARTGNITPVTSSPACAAGSRVTPIV